VRNISSVSNHNYVFSLYWCVNWCLVVVFSLNVEDLLYKNMVFYMLMFLASESKQGLTQQVVFEDSLNVNSNVTDCG